MLTRRRSLTVSRLLLPLLPLALVTVPLSCCLLLTGCGRTSPGADRATSENGQRTERLLLTGSSTVAPLMMEIGRRFERDHPGVRVDVQTGGSSQGIADAVSGVADIGMASRNLRPEETNLQPHPIARDGVCLIVHSDNPTPSLTDQQVVGIYSGKIKSWKQLGWKDRDIVVVHKAAGRATQEVFLAHFPLEDVSVEADVIVGDNQQGIKTVAGNPLAIGYVSIGAAEAEARAGTAIRLVAADETAATTENVANGSFPITRPLNLLTSEHTSELAAALIEFAQSPKAHETIQAQYFVPIVR